MGAACCNYQPKDLQALNLEKNKPKVSNVKPHNALSAAQILSINTSFAKGSKQLYKVIKIQALVRGYLVRRHNKHKKKDEIGIKVR